MGVWNWFLLLTLILKENALETLGNIVLKGQKASMDCSGFFCGLEVFHSSQAQGHCPEKREHSDSILGEIALTSGSYLWLILT